MVLRVPSEVQARLLDVLAIDTDVIKTQRLIREANSAIIALDTDSDYLALVREAEEAEDRLDDARKTCEHLESDITVARKRIERDREREVHTNDPKELSDLEDEIHSLERRIEMLESDLLDAMEDRETLEATRDELVHRRDTFHDSRDARGAELAAEIDAANARLSQLATERAGILTELPRELVELYERQRERYGVGASFLQRGVTSASGVQLSPSQLDEIRLTDPDSVIMCPDSNAILIRTKDSGL